MAATKSKKGRVESVYKKYYSALKGFINKQISSNTDESEDILHDLFYRFIVADGEDEAIENVSSWLYRVARNQIIDRSRKRREESMPYLKKNSNEESLEFPLAELMSQSNYNIEDEIMRMTISEQIESALSELPPLQRNAYELNELQGISFKDISEATGIPIATLISQKRYAVLYLRKRLESLYKDLEH